MKAHRYHAFAKLKSTNQFRILMVDLSERELKKRVVSPYKAGKDIYLSSTVTKIDDIERLVIVRTSDPAQDELKRISDEHEALIARENRESGIVILGPGRGRTPLELIDKCEDVTSGSISDAPGSGTLSTKAHAFFHNQWVIGIGLLIIGVVIGKFWGTGA